MAKQAKVTFYRPHRRIQEHGEIINLVTGEAVIPPSMTKQEFVRESDINNIVKHFSPNHMAHLTAMVRDTGRFEDLPDSVDYQESLHLVRDAEQAFMALPSKVRDQFGQDPAEFLAFITNPANLDEARKLGLAKPAPPPKAPDPAPDQAPPPAPPKA